MSDCAENVKSEAKQAVECPICLSQGNNGIVSTKCEHKFCKRCVMKLLTGPSSHDPLRASERPTCPVCRQVICPYDITNLETGKTLMEKPTTIFGGVYIQGGTEGLASYHFVSEKDSYISYSAAPPLWRLADDSPPPVSKPFLHATYHPEIRTFRAIVDWSDVNFGGDAQWIYRIVFSEDFMKIEGGEVLGYRADGQRSRWNVYEQDLAYVRLITENHFTQTE